LAIIFLIGPIRLIRPIGLVFQSTGKVALQPGYPEQPQNRAPAFTPFRAMRNTMGLLQAGHGFWSIRSV